MIIACISSGAGQKQAFWTGHDVCSTHALCLPYASPRQTLPLKRSTIGATIGVRRMRADWSSSNYQAKANFRIEIMKVLDHGNAWAPAETFGQDRINQKIRLARVILTEVYCTGSLHSGNGSCCERSQMKYT